MMGDVVSFPNGDASAERDVFVVEENSADHFATRLRPTPFDARTSSFMEVAGWKAWSGYRVAACFRDVELEYAAIRNAATLFDLSPMVKYRVAGTDAAQMLDRLTVRNVTNLPSGRVQSTLWCDDAGKVMDDGTLFGFDDETFRLCCQERHYPWLVAAAAEYDVEIDDVTDEVAALALQGPTSFAVLDEVGIGNEIADLPPFQFRSLRLLGGERVTVSRTGFTGDLGYELWMRPGDALAVWDALAEAGELFGLTPIGSAALNIARIEAGYVMTNQDFMASEQVVRPDRARSPFEIGLGWMVDFNKPHFNGRRALVAERDAGSARTCLVGLDIDGNIPAQDALVMFNGKRTVGHVTSACWSPTTKRNIALAVLERPFGDTETEALSVEVYSRYELEWVRTLAPAQVVKRPFFDPPRRRATPPALF